MIKLEQVSTRNIYIVLSERLKWSTIEPERYFQFKNLLDTYSVNDYGRLKQLIEMNIPEFQDPFFITELYKVEDKIQKANELGLEPELYFTKGGITIDEKTLETTEKNKHASVLLLKRPAIDCKSRFSCIDKYSIYELKLMLSYLNDLLKNSCRMSKTLSKDDMNKMVKAIDFYEEYLQKEYDEIKSSEYSLHLPCDISRVHLAEKCDLAEEQLKESVEYLVDTGHEFVWGKLNSYDKKRMLESINKPQSFIKRNIMQMLTNYTTFGELQQGLVKTRVLDRFIVKYN